MSFEPPIYSAINRMNHGPGKSTVLKCAALCAPLPEDTRVTRQLERKQEIYITDKMRKKSSVYRTRRRAFVKEIFEMYFKKKKLVPRLDIPREWVIPPYQRVSLRTKVNTRTTSNKSDPPLPFKKTIRIAGMF